MEKYEKVGNERDVVFSKSIRAGKRTYFFDIKATRNNDYYLTITESKKLTEQDGNFRYEKHKIFLYKEDFVKFSDVLDEMGKYIADNQVMDEKPGLNEADVALPEVDFDNFNKL